MGEPERGLAAMEKGAQQFATLSAAVPLAYTLALHVELLCEVERNAEALALTGQALALAERREERRWVAEIHRLRGELLLRTGAPAEDALRALAQARETAAQQGARMLELRALCSLVRAGDPDARPALAALYAGFTEGLDEPDLVDARALL
jgi:predicted ATPase